MQLIHRICFLAVLHAANLSLGLDMIWFMLTSIESRGEEIDCLELVWNLFFFFFLFLLLEMESVSRECCSTG